MSEFSKEFLEKTRQFWEPRCGYPLTLEDAREIAGNMMGFLNLLDKLDRKYGDEKEKNV